MPPKARGAAAVAKKKASSRKAPAAKPKKPTAKKSAVANRTAAKKKAASPANTKCSTAKKPPATSKKKATGKASAETGTKSKAAPTADKAPTKKQKASQQAKSKSTKAAAKKKTSAKKASAPSVKGKKESAPKVEAKKKAPVKEPRAPTARELAAQEQRIRRMREVSTIAATDFLTQAVAGKMMQIWIQGGTHRLPNAIPYSDFVKGLLAEYFHMCYNLLLENSDPYVTDMFGRMGLTHSPLCMIHTLYEIGCEMVPAIELPFPYFHDLSVLEIRRVRELVHEAMRAACQDKLKDRIDGPCAGKTIGELREEWESEGRPFYRFFSTGSSDDDE